MNADERAIRQLVTDWMEASKRGDNDTVLDLMTDDVIFITPGKPPFGKEAFRSAPAGTPTEAASCNAAAATPQMDGTAEILELEVLSDDTALLRNYLDITIAPPSATPMRLAGHTLTIVRKGADGKWRVFRDANFVAPLP